MGTDTPKGSVAKIVQMQAGAGVYPKTIFCEGVDVGFQTSAGGKGTELFVCDVEFNWKAV